METTTLTRTEKTADRNPHHTQTHLPFRTATVLGAGTMGAQIAAHLSNAGLSVLLLDITPDEGDPDEVVRRGLDRAVRQRPDPFFSEEARRRVEIGNFDRDFERIADFDWIIEAVVERADVKKAVLDRVEEHAAEDAVISTNTSGIPISELIEGRGDQFARRFLGTHFFNPPRYLKLLELIPTDKTDAAVTARVQRFARLHLGKGPVVAKDRPYFIGNRIGVYGLLRSMRYFTDGALSIEEVDELTGPLVGRPKSGTFRTADVVGLDVLHDVVSSMYERLEEDEQRESFRPPSLLANLVGAGAVGAKAGAGFYRKEGKEIKRVSPDGASYTALQSPNLGLDRVQSAGGLEERLNALYRLDNRAGQFFRETTLDLLAYSARRIPEITETPADIDRAMRWGFGWEMGPFQIWDALGFERVLDDIASEGIELPAWVRAIRDAGAAGFYRHRGDSTAVYVPTCEGYEDDGRPGDVLLLPAIREDARAVLWENEEAALVDIGQNVALFEFRSKGNSLSRAVMEGLIAAIDVVEQDPDMRGMVIGNEGKNFSVGANLAEVADAVSGGDLAGVERFLRGFQRVIQRVFYCRKPIVVAAHQRVLGGGCEMVMASPNPVASAETYAGLVELAVGLIPAGTGTMRLAARAAERSPSDFPSHIQPYVQQFFEQVARADVSTSAEQARSMGYLPDNVIIVMNDDRRLYVAREQVVRLANQGYMPPPERVHVRVLGAPARAALEVAVDQYRLGGFISEYDAYLATQLAYVITGGDLSAPQDVHENYLLELEVEVFLRLAGQEKTQQRIAHMLKTRKPLRN